MTGAADDVPDETSMRLSQAEPRIIVLTPYFRPVMGGVESNAERFARYLHGHRFDVQVLTKRVTSDLPASEEIDGVRVERIGPAGQRSATGKWQMLPAVMAWLIRERSTYDIVCCIDYRGTGVAAIVARTMTRRPVVLQAQTTGVIDGGGLVERVGKWLPRMIYARGDAFACISRVIEREVLRRGIPRQRVHYLPNAIDMTRFRPATPAEKRALRLARDLPADALICLFVGRLSLEKGLMELMEAWQSVEHAVLLVAGPDMDGHPWNVGPAAREFASTRPFRAPVRFLGPIVDVAPLLRAADIVIQPSHFEALGLSAIEALASGVPVVASAVGGLLDFMADDVNGKTCPPSDPPALAAAIRALVEDTGLRQRLAANARASVVKEFDEQFVFGRFVDLLRSLVGGRS